MKIEHFAINVEHPVEMVAWYIEHLGMSLVRSNLSLNQMHFIADESGRVVIEIYSNPAAPVPDYQAMDPLVFHIAFAVEGDIEPERDRLIAAGATAYDTVATTPVGDQLLFLRDPWGVPLQLVKRAKPLMS